MQDPKWQAGYLIGTIDERQRIIKMLQDFPRTRRKWLGAILAGVICNVATRIIKGENK
jgi:hypothetical protein